jgi:N-acetylmuramoyl-L-alanine amidase
MMAAAILSYMLMPFSGTAEAADDFSSRAAGMTEITGVRFSATADKVRVVVDTAGEVDYKASVLKAPGRVVVDLTDAWLSPKAKHEQSIGGPFASKVRIAQHDKRTVRVVVETTMGTNDDNYDVFSLAGGASPYRIVMDFGNLRGSSADRTIKLPGAAKPQPVKPQTKPQPAKPATTKPQTVKPKSQEQQEAEQAAKEAGESSQPAQPAQAPSYPASGGIAGKAITLDPGHGGNDSGAIGPTGVMEKSITLRISQRVQQLLEARGAKVIMTRTTDTEVSPKHAAASDVEELQARCDAANNSNSAIFVCIHMDSFSSGAARGTTGYYYEGGSAASQRLADAVRSGVVSALGTDSRGTKSCHFYVLKHTDMPATLVEVAFVSNPDEERLLNTDDGVEKAANGIVAGIADYFGG